MKKKIKDLVPKKSLSEQGLIFNKKESQMNEKQEGGAEGSVDFEQARKTSWPEVFRNTGLGLMYDQGKMLCLCQWHNDKNPSLRLLLRPNGETQLHCFACDEAKGSAIDLVAKAKGISFREAAKLILNKGGM